MIKLNNQEKGELLVRVQINFLWNHFGRSFEKIHITGDDKKNLRKYLERELKFRFDITDLYEREEYEQYLDQLSEAEYWIFEHRDELGFDPERHGVYLGNETHAFIRDEMLLPFAVVDHEDYEEVKQKMEEGKFFKNEEMWEPVHFTQRYDDYLTSI